MTWLIWRLHRTQLSIGVALLAALTVLLLITGLQMAARYHSALVGCAANHTCAGLPNTLFLGNHAVGFLVIMTLGVPVLFGLFLGAPLVATELESGTGQFAWMQSITRKRWLAVTTGWLLLTAAVWGGAVSGLVTWWSSPDNALQLDAFKPGRFDIMGIVPVGYAVFAMALGIAAGAVVRRTLPAMAITLAGFIAVRAAIALWVRPYYLSPVTITYNLLKGYTPPGSAWSFAQGTRGPAGNLIPPANGVAVDGVPLGYLPSSCAPTGRGNSGVAAACQHALAGFRGFVTYQPADRYWTFQGIETAIFAVLAAALIALAAVVLLRRDV